MTQGLGGKAGGRNKRCDTAPQAPCDMASRATTQLACAWGERQRVRAWPGHWSVSRYKILYHGGGVAFMSGYGLRNDA